MYGGTKTEMERLLADAEKISGVHYDISNLSDVYQAIHVIQGELGITGTTAKEASTTITGSINSAKSAVQNFLAGTGGVEEVISTFTTAGTNIGNAIVKMAPQIISGINGIIEGIMPQIPGAINKLLPVVIEGATTIIQGLIAMAPQLVTMFNQLLPSLISGITNIILQLIAMAPQIISMLSQMLPTIITQVINGLRQVAKALITQLPVVIPQVITAIIEGLKILNEHFDEFLMLGVQIIWAITLGLIKSIPTIIQNLPTIIQAIINFFTVSKLIGAGKTLLTGLGKGLINGVPSLLKKIPQIIGNMINIFKTNGVSGFKNVGSMLIHGLWSGIGNMGPWVISKIKGLGKSILNAVKGIFGVHSPSTEFAWIGKMNMVGLKEGMENMQPDLQKTINGMFDLSPNIYGSASTHLSPNINVVVNNNMKQDPLGQMVNDIKTFSGGSKNDYNYVGA